METGNKPEIYKFHIIMTKFMFEPPFRGQISKSPLLYLLYIYIMYITYTNVQNFKFLDPVVYIQ